jgi:hypothetical protein
MPQLPAVLEAAGWHVSFHACGDRIAHTIGLNIDGRIVPLLASVEGTSDDDWPPSPPLTTVETTHQAGAQQAMLLGMAGRSHWSLSVVLDEAARCLRFDVACRLKERPRQLGSCYRSMVSAQSPGDGMQLSVDGRRVRVEAPSHQLAMQITPDGLNVPVEPAHGDFPQTVRWSYAICHGS